MYSTKEILAQLDKCTEEFTFPMLDNGYIYPISTKLLSYRDTERWIIVIEVIGFSYRGGGHNGISNCLHVYGNCLNYLPGTSNNNFLSLTDNSKEGFTFNQEYEDHLNSNVSTMLLKDIEIKVNHTPKFYHKLGINLSEIPKIMVWEFMRGLVPTYKDKLHATEIEIRERIPKDIPHFITLNDWHHPDVCSDEFPSKNQTFIMLAKALEQGDLKEYKPTKKMNTHWSNWPEGGTL